MIFYWNIQYNRPTWKTRIRSYWTVLSKYIVYAYLISIGKCFFFINGYISTLNLIWVDANFIDGLKFFKLWCKLYKFYRFVFYSPSSFHWSWLWRSLLSLNNFTAYSLACHIRHLSSYCCLSFIEKLVLTAYY